MYEEVGVKNAEVIGESYVAIYDRRRQLPNGGKFYLLAPGDRLNLFTRVPTRRAYSEEAFEKLRNVPWP